ncbi:MAG: hypothetical protein Q8K78_15640 [Planctomycetaceae bacterium]|nr:hypothetical protein [Planctomycetaceae bacterium]
MITFNASASSRNGTVGATTKTEPNSRWWTVPFASAVGYIGIRPDFPPSLPSCGDVSAVPLVRWRG